MRKLLCIVLLIMGIAAILTACGNAQFIDTAHTYNKVMIKMPNDTIIFGDVENWAAISSCDRIKVKLKDGKTYYTSSENIVLIAE